MCIRDSHYHELTELEGGVDGVKNYNIAVKKRGEDITFLRRIDVYKRQGLPEGTDRTSGNADGCGRDPDSG